MRAALRLLALCAVLVAAQAASSTAHGSSKGRGDGYNVPISKNSAWKFYRFAVTNGNSEITSFRPPVGLLPLVEDGPGAIATGTGELVNEKGGILGANQWSIVVVGVEKDTEKILIQSLTANEFGSPGNYADAILTSAIVRRDQGETGALDNHIAQITGGRGKFLGATGIARVVFEEGEGGLIQPSVTTFEVLVPNNLPNGAGAFVG